MTRFQNGSRLLSYTFSRSKRTSSVSPTTALLQGNFQIQHSRHFSNLASATTKEEKEPWWKDSMDRLRNIGISAHIDSGKTTLTERILFYTGRIHEIHEVRGRDGVGAKMDSMDLEREKGITIQSAATYCTWNGYQVNIIDTPGHVDFTIEVERALRVLDGAILVLCSVGGVQSQSITVDRQMRRYEVPRLAFINKLDRMGADPWKVLNQARSKLRHHSAAVQVPIGLEDDFQGLIDLVKMKAYYFHGSNGEKIVTAEIPVEIEALAAEKRRELIETVSEVDDKLADAFLADESISTSDLEEAIRRATVAKKFVPVFMGSAFKNKGVQPLLDGVLSYLPCPLEVSNYALDQTKDEEKVVLSGTPDGPLVALAFKLEEGRFGQLTYLRIYEGVIRKGDFIVNVNTGKKIKVPRLVRMHSNEMEDIQEAHVGQIVAVFGVDCASGDTFTDGSVRYTMTSMNVPEPVMSLAIQPVSKDSGGQFSKALNRFQKEDPRENRDLVAKEERNEDVNGNANAGNNEMETETGTEGVADVAAKLETLSQEVETVEAEVTEVKEKLEVAENMENMEKKDAVEEKKEDADVVDKVEMDNVVEEAETVKVKEEEEGAEKTEISGVGGEVEAVEQKQVTDFVEEGKAEKSEVADVAGEMEAVELIEMTEIVEEENVEKMEANEEEEKQPPQQVEMTDIAEETREDEKNEMTDIEEMKVAEKIETTDVAGGMEEAINEEGEMKETEKIDVAEEGDKEEDTKVEMAEKENEAEDMLDEMEGEMKETEMIDVAEEGDKEEDAKVEMAEKENEAEDMLDEMEGAEEEVEKVGTSGGGGKRKRQKNAKAPSRATSKKKTEEDVCFICFDGGELVLCDRRGCPKAYHPSCVNRDEAFFRAKGRWNCGWHLCSNCEKNAYYMCYTCTFSLCKGCIKDAVILCVRGNKGFCETCMKTVMLIERNEQGNKETGQVDFDDKSSWEFLFKDYWTDLKERLSLTPEELAQAKNPWKGSDSHAGKQELADELYDVHNGGSGSGPDSSENAEVTTSKRRKPKKRLRSRAKERDSPGSSSWAGGESADESVEWASKELLEFVMHVKNGDKSACSQFDVQALLLEYIKRNKLRDPRRKSQIICDSRLENLFGKPRVGHFEMLKLLESHYLLKDDSQADDLQGSVVDTEANQLEADGNSDALMKASKDKRRRSRKKGEGRGLQSNIDDYAAIDMHNINLIYLRRSLLEDLIEDTEAFYNKVVGSFVRIRISGSAQKQDLYRLVQIIGTSKAAEPYRVGKKMTNFMLEILNLNKTELVSIDIISNQEFTEDECKRLRQSIKCGLIHRLTVGDIQEKAMAIQAVRVQDLLEAEITRFSHLCDRASDMGHRKELRECVEKLQLLKTPEERQRRLEEIPEIHADPNMDPSHESDEDESETEDKRQENSLRRRGSGFSRRGREQISPRKGGFASNDTWGGSRSYASMNREPSRNMTDKGFSNEGDDFGAGEAANENLWGQGREKPTQQSQSWEMPKTASNASQARNSTVISESVPRVAPEISPATPSTVVAQSTAKVNEAEKIWHYKDPSGKNQGPFSMVQLRKWSNTGYFPADLRIWRNTETKDDSILLTDALSGNFQSDPPAVDNSFPKTQLVQSPHLPSSYTGNIAQAAPVPVEVPKYSTDRWGSGTNLPSPTPGQTTTSLMKGQVFESQVTPTQSQPVGSVLGANQSSGDNVEQQHATVISGTPKVSHGVSPVPKLETGMLPSSSNAPQMHSQSMLTGESPKVLVNSHLHSALDTTGASVNAAVDIRSLQNLVQPVTSGNSHVGTHGWAGSISRPEMNASHAAVTGTGSQAWGSTQSHKAEANNLVSMPSQPSTYGNWSNAPTSVQNPTSSLTTGNPSGFSPVTGTGTNPWRAPVPGPSNIQPSAPSSRPWGMGITENQSTTPRQGSENQNTGWGAIPGNQNMGWGVSLPANSNQCWVAPGQVPATGNVKPVWVAPVQGQAPGNANPGWGAPVQGQAPGNAFSGWGPSVQGSAPTSANTAWVPLSQGPPPPGNANTNWAVPTGNAGTWGSDMNQIGDRFSSPKERGSHGGDSGHGGGKPWNRQSSFGRSGDSPRPSFKGQRVCKYHEHGHCKKGSSCDYLHT